MSDSQRSILVYDHHLKRVTKLIRNNFPSSAIAFSALLANTIALDTFLWYPRGLVEHGPGPFFSLFLIITVVCGIPMMGLETSIGQFRHGGAVKTWDCYPILSGISVSGMLACSVTIMEATLMAGYSLNYIIRGIWSMIIKSAHIPPWATCGNQWNDATCITRGGVIDLRRRLRGVHIHYSNYTRSEEQFFTYKVAGMNIDLEAHRTVCGPSAEIFLGVFGTLLLVLLCVIRGVANLGKVIMIMWILVMLGFILLYIIIVYMPGGGGWREVLEPSGTGKKFRDGMAEGIVFTFTLIPDLDALARPQLWFAVSQQVFFAHTVGQSTLPSLASFNNFHEPVLTWSVIIGVMNMGITIATTVLTYSLVGQQAQGVQTNIEDLTDDHFFILKSWQFAFKEYPMAITGYHFATFRLNIFFGMIFLSAISSCAALSESQISVFMDVFPSLRQREHYLQCGYFFILLVVCLPFICLGKWAQMMYMYIRGASEPIVYLTCFLECVAVCYGYGYDNFEKDLQKMFAGPVRRFWKVTWKYITPPLCLIFFTVSIYNHVQRRLPSWTCDPCFEPDWKPSLYICVMIGTFMWIPLFTCHRLCQKGGFSKTSLAQLTKPTADWGYLQ